MSGPPERSEETDPVALLSPAISEALNGIEVPSYVIDSAGTLRWANRAATRLLGERLGQPYLSFVCADARDRAKDHFARKVVGGFPTSYEIAVFDRDGRRVRLNVHAAPLRAGGRIVGIFALAISVENGMAFAPRDDGHLTPRQVEILRLLAEGLTRGRSPLNSASQLRPSAITSGASFVASAHIRGLRRFRGPPPRSSAFEQRMIGLSPRSVSSATAPPTCGG